MPIGTGTIYNQNNNYIFMTKFKLVTTYIFNKGVKLDYSLIPFYDTGISCWEKFCGL